jgi:hypothetical protein
MKYILINLKNLFFYSSFYIMYKSKYLKYKNKYNNLKKIIGGTVPDCIKMYHDNNFKNIKTMILSVDTYLLHGNGLFNKLDVSTSDIFDKGTKEIKYFNTTHIGSVAYSLTNKKSHKDSGYIGLYQVTSPIKIYAQKSDGPFYFDTKEDYESNNLQCLCNDGYNGYCSYDNLNDIKKIYNIGLCNYVGKIKLIGYVEIKQTDQSIVNQLQVYKYDGNLEPYIDDSNLFLVDSKPVTMEMIDILNQSNINCIYDDMDDITE